MELVAHSETLDHQGHLQQFSQQLQEFLLSLPQGIPFQVHCVLKRHNLMVLSEHPPDEKPDTHQVFDALEQAIQVFLPGFVEEVFESAAIPQNAEAKLYLRKLGQKQPYAFHAFNLDSVDEQEPVSSETIAVLSEDLKQLEQNLDREGEDFDLDQLLVLTEPEAEANSLAPDSPESEEAVAEKEPEARSPWLWWIAAGVGVSIVSFIGGIVLVSRPCIIGRCEPVQVAAAMNQQASQTLQKATSEQDLKQAQQKLTEANEILRKIPLWSGQYGEAKSILTDGQTQLSQLDRVLAAENKAKEAMQKGRTIPQTLAEWDRVQTLWKSAIAELEAIPQGTPLYSFVQQRLTTYRENLLISDQFKSAEQQAQKKLLAAKSAAGTAQAREGVAQSIANWQQVQVTWQVAVDALKQIPNTTTSFTEAQQLLGDYSAKLEIARDRATREQLAQKSYSEAVSLGQKAQTLQRQNQWSQAVINWRSALKQIEQIPENTAPYEKSQLLVSPYTNSLQQAETQLRTAVSQQKLKADLNRVCAGSPKTCTYFVLTNMIRIQFTPMYEKALQQAIVAGQTGNYGALGGVTNNIDSLQAALQAISNNSGLPIEVYNSTGTEMVGSFNPS